jgi:hypothetical protein
MLVGLGQKLRFILGRQLVRKWLIILLKIGSTRAKLILVNMALANWENIDKRRLRWVLLVQQTDLDYLICMEMFGNGVWITGMIVMRGHRSMEVLGYLIKETSDIWYVAAPGTTIQEIAVLLLAPLTSPEIVTANLGLELCVKSPGLCNLLPSKLYSIFFSLLIRRRQLEILRHQNRLLLDFELVAVKRYEFAGKALNDIGTDLGGWIKQR